MSNNISRRSLIAATALLAAPTTLRAQTSARLLIIGGGFGGAGGMNMEDIFSNFGDIFGDESPFGSFFSGGRGGGGRRQRKGSDLRIKLKLNLEEIIVYVCLHCDITLVRCPEMVFWL